MLLKNRSPELPMPLAVEQSGADSDSAFGVSEYAGKTAAHSPANRATPAPHVRFWPDRNRQRRRCSRAPSTTTSLTARVAVLDPHGDMFRELLQIIPPHRRRGVIVFDPTEQDWPVLGINLLNPGIDFAGMPQANQWITSSVISIFHKLADEKYWGPRMEHLLRNVTLTALSTPDPNLYTLQRLLTERTYQKDIAKTLEDPVLRQFWDEELSSPRRLATSQPRRRPLPSG